MPPETRQKDSKPNGTNNDIWAMGVLTYIMHTSMLPFAGKDKVELDISISKGNYKIPVDFDPNSHKFPFSLEALDFIEMTLQNEV